MTYSKSTFGRFAVVLMHSLVEDDFSSRLVGNRRSVCYSPEITVRQKGGWKRKFRHDIGRAGSTLVGSRPERLGPRRGSSPSSIDEEG